MSTLLKIAFAAVVVRAVMYVARRTRPPLVSDAEPAVAEPIQPQNLNVAQNTPL